MTPTVMRPKSVPEPLAKPWQSSINAAQFHAPTTARTGGKMAGDNSPTGAPPVEAETVIVSEEALLKAEAFVEAEEGAANRLMGWAGRISTGIAVVMSLFHLYAAYAIVPTQELRYTHVAFTLVLSFLLFPLATRFRNRVRWWDIVPGLFAVATIVYALWGGEDFTDRATTPD